MCMISGQSGQSSVFTYITHFYFENTCSMNQLLWLLYQLLVLKCLWLKMFFTFLEDHKLLGYVLSFVSVLFRLKLPSATLQVFY